MTINDIEQQSEMKQATSQFYEEEKLPQVFHPWRRYFARILDITIYSVIWTALLGLVFQINISTRGNWENIFDSFVGLGIMLLLEPIWLHLIGTTPGKAIFGFRIEAADGRLLTYKEGVERTWRVIGSGLGYNIPIYNLVRLWKSYKICSDKEVQPWDESISYTMKDVKWYRIIVAIGAYVLSYVFILMILSAQLFPPNRGNLTIAEYSENFNYYANYYEINFGNMYLDETGNWIEKENDGTFYVNIGKAVIPNYEFVLENGYVTTVSFEIEVKNNKEWLGSNDNQMILSSLAVACAQDNMGLFSKIPNRIAKQISKNTLKDFNFSEDGVSFECDIEYSGYENTSMGMLIPDEDVLENYYSIQYVIHN